MRGTNILIVLDGFERLLRQYGRMDAALVSDDEDAEIDPSQRDCSSPLTETFLRGLSGAGMKSKVLMTTRLCPRVLESADGKLLKGCRDEPLSAFSPEDAVTYFHNEGIKTTRAEIIEVCSAYEYHPLSLSLLVGLINKSHEHKGDIVVAKNLDIFGDIKTKHHHILKYAYESLLPDRRELLSKISCFRGSIEYATIKKVFDSPDLEKSLIDLHERGLLQYTEKTQRYDMHPIVRHYAYDHFTDEKRRKEAHVELAKYFNDNMSAANTNVKTLEDLAPVIELYHHMVRAENLDEALKLFHDRLHDQIYYQFGAYQLCIELLRALFLEGEDKPSRLKDERTQGWTLTVLSQGYGMSGQPANAMSLLRQRIALAEKLSDNKNMAISLGNTCDWLLLIGTLSEAERNLHRKIDLSREIADEHNEAIGHRELGRVFFYRGEWNDSKQELETAEKLFEKEKHVQSLSVTWSYRALRFLLMAREVVGSNQSPIVNLKSSIQCAQCALELADEQAKDYPVPRDYIRAHWLLGAAYRVNNELTLAEENLSKALNLCRQINMVDHEADILLDLARLRYASHKSGGTSQDDLKDAQEKASEALMITERSGYVLQGADVNLFLAELAMAGYKLQVTSYASDKEAAIYHAKEALRLATCDGGEYKYKVAYDEAERMLARMKDEG